MIQNFIYGGLGAAAIVVSVYICARVAGLGWFRSKREFEITVFNKRGDKPHG